MKKHEWKMYLNNRSLSNYEQTKTVKDPIVAAKQQLWIHFGWTN